MVQAKKGDVKVHYTGKFTDGMPFDTSEGAEPVEFKIGEGKLIPGFEEAMIGNESGRGQNCHHSPREGLWLLQRDKIIKVDKRISPRILRPKSRMTLEVSAPNGQFIPVQVTEVKGDKITLDAQQSPSREGPGLRHTPGGDCRPARVRKAHLKFPRSRIQAGNDVPEISSAAFRHLHDLFPARAARPEGVSRTISMKPKRPAVYTA